MPIVSLIIPIYNVEKYLRKCLDSVINQSFSDIEIICVDDGSTDNSLNIIKEYAQQDNRLKIITQKNQGVSFARNQGLKKASGDYILFLDSDDWLELDCIEKGVNAISKNDSDILCFGINCFNNGKITPREDILILDKYYEQDNFDTEVIKHLVQNACGKLFKRSFLIKNKIEFPKNIKTCEDGLFCLLCIYEEPKIQLLNKCLYYYRIGREGSACTKQGTIVETDIEAFKYILSTNNYKNAKEEYKILTINKFIQHFEWNDIPKYRLINYIRISKFKKYLYKNINKNLLIRSRIDDIDKFDFKKFLLKKIFSITNSKDGKHKIITIIGIKLKFKKGEEKEQKKYQKRYKRILKNLKLEVKNRKIRVIFLVNESSKFKTRQLYESFEKSNHFDPVIAITLSDIQWSMSKEEQVRQLRENYNFFKQNEYNVVYAYDFKLSQNLDLKFLNPDMVFFQQPYQLSKNQSIEYVSNFALTYYVPYYLPDYINSEVDYSVSFHSLLYKYFILNKKLKSELKLYIKNLKCDNKNIIPIGHPFIDIIKRKCTIGKSNYIIYAPHWSITEKGNENIINISTFNINGNKILEFAKQHKELNWVFKPHPTLKTALLRIGKSEEEINEYYKEWESFAKCCYDGSYLDIFNNSYALITDCGSFLFEYFCTGKPVIHLISPYSTNKPHTFLQKAFDTFYQIKSDDDMNDIFDKVLINRNDYLKSKRLKSLKKLNISKSNASINILKNVMKDLGI